MRLSVRRTSSFSHPPASRPSRDCRYAPSGPRAAINVMFPEITTIGGYRQDPLKWHPNGLGDRRDDPEPQLR